jgi:di/tricarboxylate transporter
MTDEYPLVRRPLQTVRRFIARTVLTVVAVIGGLFLMFVCQNTFAGYPKYHSALLSIIGMILIALTGAVAWIIDERRIDADD